MNLITLPLLHLDTSLAKARDAMKRASKSGVVGREGNKYWLFSAPEIYQGLSKRLKRLDQLEKRLAVHTPPARSFATKGIDLLQPRKTSRAFETLLDDIQARYVYLGDTDDYVRIGTRHESDEDPYSRSPSDCYCEFDKPPEEACPYLKHTKPADGVCPRHGKKIKCSP